MSAQTGGGWDTAVETQDYTPDHSTNGGAAPQGVGSIFVDQSERIVATIGSNYLQNFLSGGTVEQGVGVLTQKRFYFKGQNYSGVGKDIQSTTEEGVVSIEDITFTKFTYARPTGLLIAAIILTIFVVTIPVALFFYVRYFTNRQTLFLVSFPGGDFAFDIRWYPISDIRDFQRQLHLLKDHIKESAAA